MSDRNCEDVPLPSEGLTTEVERLREPPDVPVSDTHQWGPHEEGIRWVQCRRCKCLLHEPEAQQRCVSRKHVNIRRKRRMTEAFAKLREVARRESSWR